MVVLFGILFVGTIGLELGLWISLGLESLLGFKWLEETKLLGSKMVEPYLLVFLLEYFVMIWFYLESFA